MEAVARDPCAAARRLSPGMVPPLSGQSIESLLAAEAEIWSSGGRESAVGSAPVSPIGSAAPLLPAPPPAADGSFSVARSGPGIRAPSATAAAARLAAIGEPGGGGRVLSRGGPDGSGGGGSGRGLGLSPGGGGGGGPSGAEPASVLRHPALRAEWQRRIGAKERVPWREFWYKLVQPQVGGVPNVFLSVSGPRGAGAFCGDRGFMGGGGLGGAGFVGACVVGAPCRRGAWWRGFWWRGFLAARVLVQCKPQVGGLGAAGLHGRRGFGRWWFGWRGLRRRDFWRAAPPRSRSIAPRPPVPAGRSFRLAPTPPPRNPTRLRDALSRDPLCSRALRSRDPPSRRPTPGASSPSRTSSHSTLPY
jgi:hypothetical protein